jgi:hypothetical protein
MKRLAVLAAILLWASGTWAATKYKVLYSFQGGSDGANPVGGLTLDAAGNLYGVTANGGNENQCVGAILGRAAASHLSLPQAPRAGPKVCFTPSVPRTIAPTVHFPTATCLTLEELCMAQRSTVETALTPTAVELHSR